MPNVEIPEFWLPRPPFELSPERLSGFEVIYRTLVQPGEGACIDLSDMPKWVFLTWLCEAKGLLLHGSVDHSIQVFEPRTPKARDDDLFSQQTAVFASGDGIYPIFNAVLDREHFRPRILSAVLRFALPEGLSDPRYFFSITDRVLAQHPWREGTVYVLPPRGFVQQPPYRLGRFVVHDPHFASPSPVRPLAKIRVGLHDFPFLNQVRAHNDTELVQRFTADPDGFPWLEV